MRYIDKDGVLITIYYSYKSSGKLLWSLEKACEDIARSRHVISRLFWRDFVAQFRQKILGYLWALLGPLLGIISFLFLFFVGVLKPGESEIPYTAYVLIGGMIWSCLPTTIAAVSNGLQNQSDLILRTSIPKLALAISSLAGALYNIVISMITTGIALVIIGIKPSWWFLAYPLLIMPIILLGTAIGLILSVFGSIAKDLTPLVLQMITLIMYLTPVVYLPSTIQNTTIRSIIEWNPISPLVEIPRSLICLGHTNSLSYFLWVSLGTIILTILALHIFYALEDLVPERL
jgi:lipopolysaccharide transport system permease protein